MLFVRFCFPSAVDTLGDSGLEYVPLMRLIPLALAAFFLALAPHSKAAATEGNGVVTKRVPSAAPLPLALNDEFKIEKVFSLLIDPALTGALKHSDSALTGASKPTDISAWLQMETARRYFGAINKFERRARDGHAYTIHWKVRPATKGEVTVRFEYRQKKLGSYVQTQDVVYPKASGSMRTEFAVQGDEYHQDGAVIAWRVLLIEDSRVVGLQQSFLW